VARDVLFLCGLSEEAPSARTRVYMHAERLREHGILARVEPLVRGADSRRFYSRRRRDVLLKVGATSLGMVRRLQHLFAARKADLVVVHREIVPRGNRTALKWLKRTGTPILYDFDDAIWMSPRDHVDTGDPSQRRMVKFKDPSEVDDLIRGADRVAAGSPVLAAHAASLDAKVDLVPTPVDTTRLKPASRPPRDVPVVGWVGSPTATYCLRDILPALERVARRRPFVLRVVGAGEKITVPGVEVVETPWNLERETDDFADLDIGLYPLPDNPWTRGKCGYKALQYFSAGAATVLSPVGLGAELAAGGEHALPASSLDEWEEALDRLLGDRRLRADLAGRARAFVESRYSYEVVTPMLAESMARAMGDL
jgi:glycosyltransferase involved in cell wall biosynthesis